MWMKKPRSSVFHKILEKEVYTGLFAHSACGQVIYIVDKNEQLFAVNRVQKCGMCEYLDNRRFDRYNPFRRK